MNKFNKKEKGKVRFIFDLWSEGGAQWMAILRGLGGLSGASLEAGPPI